MPLNPKHAFGKKTIVRDIRPAYVRFGEWLKRPRNSMVVCLFGIMLFFVVPSSVLFTDFILVSYLLFFWWLKTRSRALPMKLPVGAKYPDTNNMGPGKDGDAEGILFIGNDKESKEQIWFTNSDARTHLLYLGTTGSGKTEGLKSFVTSAMSWGSGFVYIDGKADTDLWSSLSSLVRRYGRDDDLLVMNYMTGNSDARAPSNTMNPFSSGSASYLTQMLVSLMPEAEGDNAMWKERAVSLMSSLMPALTYKRDNQDFNLSVGSIRNFLELKNIIMLARDETLPEKIREGLNGYLDTLPGYVADAFDDEGKEKPMGPDQPMVDTTTVRQQHGFLTMQFTRALQSLGDDYGYIFDTLAADIDMVDVVLNRRVLITLIPALEKSGDETANLGKIIAATIKGMMGTTLGATLEGDSSKVIENKPTHSATPFMTVFDEVGYYTAQGMAVMAAQARSLGFCLVFAAQDLQAMEKRVKEEAKSITANCNIKIFGKLQDPTATREYFENHVGKAYIAKVSSFQIDGGSSTGSYADTKQAQIDTGTRADYDDLKEMKEGEAIISFGIDVIQANIFYSNPGHAKAMRVTRYMEMEEPDEKFVKYADKITKLRDRMCSKNWTARKADVDLDPSAEIDALKTGYGLGENEYDNAIDHGIMAMGGLHALLHPIEAQDAVRALDAEKLDPHPAPETTPLNPTPPSPEPAATQPNTPPPAQDTGTIVEERPAAATAQTEQPIAQEPVSKPVLEIKKQLREDVENILKDAGKDMRNKLFGNDE